MSPVLEIPLFPLQTVLFPDIVMPLRIFEPRYLALIQQCQKDETGFGVIALKTGNEVRGEESSNEMELHEVGTLASVVKVEEIGSEQLGIWIKGGAKFLLETHWTDESELEIGLVKFCSPEPILPINEDKDRLAIDTYFQLVDGTNSDSEATEAPLTQNIVANRLAHYIPFPLKLKQEMLEVEDPRSRLDLINRILNSI